MKVKDFIEKLDQQLGDKKNYQVVVDLLGGPFPVTSVYWDTDTKQLRIVVNGEDE